MMRLTSLVCFMSSLIWPVFASQDLLLVTIATEENDGLRRFIRSTKKYDIETKIFGLGEEWRGGNMATEEGGGQKVNILKRDLAEYKDRDDLIIMFTDSYDVVVTADAGEILEKFYKFDARSVFSAEGFCWPDQTLAGQYPEVKQYEKRYLCSGGFIGYAKEIYGIVSQNEISDKGDDQLYYTKIFLDEKLREKYGMKLDKRSEIFMNLHGALDEVTLKFKGSQSYMYNVKTGTQPAVIHGNGPIKPEFNRLANYLAGGWTSSAGCLSCSENLVSLDGQKEEDYPTVLMGIFVERATPFIAEFFEYIEALDYPKMKVDLFIHNAMPMHEKDVQPFLDKVGRLYKSVSVLNPVDNVGEHVARNWALEQCSKKDCQYFFSVDSDAQLENDQSLQLLIQQNRSVLAPLVVRHGKAWSNFWGALSNTGFYARAEDYMEIINSEKVGLWNVPYITGVYLVQSHVIPKMKDGYVNGKLDADMAMCKTLRDMGVFMFVTNQHFFGYSVDGDNYDTTHKYNDMYEIFNNPYHWEKRYIHPNYSQSLQKDAVIAQPCPDVFWFPIVTEAFCDQLVDEMESYGGWSGGQHSDPRLAGGYENVPTDDIHMNQIGMEQHWLKFLNDYVAPLATAVYPGYYSNPPRAIMNFVVKYNPERQRELRPHHDSSTFTINIALNRHHIDYEGGGCRFLRYDCSVTETKKGWMLMHPGRLTHYHEGLQIKSGTRYIMISFVDP